jgi:hypothetical protein
VSDQIHLQKTRLDIRPVSECANGDLAFEQRARFGGTDPAPSLVCTVWAERAIDRSRAHARHASLDLDRDVAQRVPVPQAAQQLRQEWRQAFAADPISHQPAQLQQIHLSRAVARRSLACAFDRRCIRRRVPQQGNRVLARIPRQPAHLVEHLALLALVNMRVPRRQRPHQVIPTGSLHLTDLTFGRILI